MATSQANTEQPLTTARMTGAELLRQMRELAARLRPSPSAYEFPAIETGGEAGGGVVPARPIAVLAR